MQVDAETGTEGSGKQAAARSGTHQREGIQIELYAARRRAFVYHDVYPVVLHGGIKIFLHYGTKPMDFVDKEHVVRLQRSQNTGQIARLVQYRAGRDLETHAQFVGYDVAQRGLPQSRRTVQQSMVEGLAPVLGSLDETFRFSTTFNCPLKSPNWSGRKAFSNSRSADEFEERCMSKSSSIVRQR